MANDTNGIPEAIEVEAATVPERPLTMAELAARCECGCLRSRHEDGEGACVYCVGCSDFLAASTCSVCEANGVEHIPEGEE